MALTLTITSAGRAAIINASNSGTAPVTITQAGLSATAFSPDTGMTNLPGEHKRLATLSGEVAADDTIHLIVRDESTDIFTVRSLALYLNDGTLFALYSQSAVLLEKSALSLMLLAIDVQFEDIAATNISFGNANFLNPPATTEMPGVAELATLAETIAGLDKTRVPAAKMVKDAVSAWLDARFGANNAAIWHPSNDGAGSGLDADLLDGRDGSYYADIVARLGYTPLNIAGGTATGRIGTSGAGSGNNPIATSVTNLGEIEVRGNGTGAAMIEFHRPNSRACYFGLDTDNELKIGGWSYGAAAFKLWHSGNDGAGSGLDADLLDGQDGSYYGNIAARLGFTPVNRAGDTMTGSLTISHAGSPSVTLQSVGGATGRLAMQVDGNLVLYRNAGAGDAPVWSVPSQAGPFAVQLPITRQGFTVWDAANDGAGSGLDADLLDGQDGSFYANVPARLGFTPANKAGDVFTGNIAIDRAGGASLSINATGSVIAKLAAQGDGTIALYRNDGGADTVVFGGSQTGPFNINAPITRQGFKVWDAANDGSGSGLDADLLDGQDGSFYANVPARLGFTPANRAGDVFTGNVAIDRAGEASLSLNATGSVIAKLAAQGDGTIALYRNDGGADTVVFGGGQTGPFNINAAITRQGFKVWDAANDGSGSGLDADLLDGQDGSYYANVPARLGFTPANRAGDVFSGNIAVDRAGEASLSLNATGSVIAKLAAQGDGTIALYRNDGGTDVVMFGANPSGPFNVNAPIARQGFTVWDAANDGSGSGLDADLLDGLQASDFAKMADFSNNLAAAGYQRLAGGLILQWCTTATQQNVETTAAATFPIQFPNAVLDVQLTTRVDIGSIESDTWYQLVGEPTLSGCTVMRARSDSDNDRPTFCRVFAIGR